MNRRPPGFSSDKKTPGRTADAGRKSLARQIATDALSSSSDQGDQPQIVRLSILGAEFGLLFGGDREAGIGLVSLSGDTDPQLSTGASISSSLSIEIDPQTNLYVLHEGDGCTFITASDDRLLGRIIANLSRRLDSSGNGRSAPHCAGRCSSQA